MGEIRATLSKLGLTPGDAIEYYGIVRNKKKASKGVVKQITSRFIAVQGDHYISTILGNDLISGEVVITKIKKKLKKEGNNERDEVSWQAKRRRMGIRRFTARTIRYVHPVGWTAAKR